MVRMKKFDKNHLQLEKNAYLCSPKFRQKGAEKEVNN